MPHNITQAPTEEGVPKGETYRLIQVIDLFRAINPNMPVQMCLTFCHVMDNPGIPMPVLLERMGMTQASGSRNVCLSDGMASTSSAWT